MTGVLSDVKVLDLSWGIAGPIAGMMSRVRSRPSAQYAAKSNTTQPAASAIARLSHGGTERSFRDPSEGSRRTGPGNGAARSGSVPGSSAPAGGSVIRSHQP